MTEAEYLEGIAEEYRKDGYKVFVEPRGEQLLPFLEGAPVDVIARKGDEVVTIQAKMQGCSGKPADARIFSAEFDGQYGLSMLKEAEILLRPETIRSALLTTWAAFEAIARTALHAAGHDVRELLPRVVIERLRDVGLITDQEFVKLIECQQLRNTLAHGLRPGSVPPETVQFVIDLAQRLMPLKAGNGLHLEGGLTATIFRTKINENPKLRRAVEQADGLLRGVLGSWLGSVAVEWDAAEDAHGRSVVTLTLSDFTGTVSATFEPWEFENDNHLKGRLYGLWTELLQIRIRQQWNVISGSMSPVGG